MPDERADEPHDPALTTGALLVVGVLAVSCSGPLAASLAAPALAVAMWRNAFGAAVVVPFAAARRRAELARVWQHERPVLGRALLAGVALAVHFGLWIPSLRLTSITASTALVTTSPLFTMLGDRLAGRAVPRAVLVGALTALAGVVVITGLDAGSSARALAGDLLALGGGAAAAVYTLLGADVRRSMSTAGYTSIAYTTCALVLLPVCLVGGVRLAGWSGSTWLGLAALTASAQLLGHSLFNRVLRSLGATTVALVILLEVPGATLVAWAFLDQAPPLRTLPGAVLVLLGLVLVVRAGARARRRSRQVEVVDGTPW
ncbi:DMT family transporter [Angustibacter aerolatus]